MTAMGKRSRLIRHLWVLSWLLLTTGVLAQSAQIQERKMVVKGWHNWYEVKVDPANPSNVLLCGSGWDSRLNAQYGFVVMSSDGGQNWRNVFEDRATAWVSEQSCAFGQNHEVYFISEASRVIDGMAHHEKGVARLFVSRDAGRHWTKTLETGWADYSSSAVSTTTGELVTFFNNAGTHDKGHDWGSTVGALVFSADGGQISGPHVEPQMRERNYQGVLPSQAIALKDGSVGALFGGAQITSDGLRYELGFERVELGNAARVTASIIATHKRCFTLDGHGLAYEEATHQLIVAYSDESPGGGCHLAVAASADNGKTWVKKVIANTPADSAGPLDHIALAAGADGLGVLWEDAGRWLFSILKNVATLEPTVELSGQPPELRVTDDSLMTFVFQPKGFQIGREESTPVATVNVRSTPGVVMRSTGLFASRGRYQAIVPVVRDAYEGLEVVSIAGQGEQNQNPGSVVSAAANGDDVTSQVVLLNGRMQSFDNATGTLSIDLRLANRGDRPIPVPIQIEATEVSSSFGPVVILNADNGLRGPGAIWDVSRTVTGNQLLPGAATYNCFRLSFHLDSKDRSVPTENFLNLKVRILAPGDVPGDVGKVLAGPLHHQSPN